VIGGRLSEPGKLILVMLLGNRKAPPLIVSPLGMTKFAAVLGVAGAAIIVPILFALYAPLIVTVALAADEVVPVATLKMPAETVVLLVSVRVPAPTFVNPEE
jgi:hypothetical protein